MKFIICALYYNKVWDNTAFSELSGDESGFYIEDKGFNFGNFSGLHKATMYDYDEAIIKLDIINKEYSEKHPEHGFVIISNTFKGKGKY